MTGSRSPREGRPDDSGTGDGDQHDPRAPQGQPGGEGHPSEEAVDALLDADLVEVRDRGGRQEGGPPPEAVTAAHVLACARCQGVLADMRGVRGLLRRQGAGTPPPPDDLAARIAAAVASDAARERRAARVRRRRSALALAASAVVVGGLGTALALQVHEAQTGGADAAASAQSAAVQDAEEPLVMASGTDYALGSLGDQLLAVLDDPSRAAEGAAERAGAPDPGRTSGSRPDAPTGERATEERATEERATGDAAGADAAAGDEAGPAGDPPVGAGGGATSEDPAGPPETSAGDAADASPSAPSGLARPEELDSCLTALGRPGADVVAVDTARWEGEPADVVVLHEPDADTGAELAVWVVRIGCSGDQDALLHYEVVRP